ncbi:MAG: CpaD family pilus assembly protein [Alphaproteobacteria bacterium]|nr:CpaD family pilus assembly protein [Alphaproteobacteria bacterium]
MTSIRRRLFGFALLLLAPILSACAEEGDWRVHQRLVVEKRPVALALPVQDDSVIKPEDMSRLQSFVDVFLQRGEAPFAITVSKGEGDEAELVAKRRASLMADLLTAMGVDQAGLRVRTAPASDVSPEGMARLGYDVYAVRVPQCGDWNENSSFTPFRNDPLPSFGCSVARNIGLMVDNPRDLIRPHALDGRDATRGATIIGKYRAGEETISKGSVTSTISTVGTQ